MSEQRTVELDAAAFERLLERLDDQQTDDLLKTTTAWTATLGDEPVKTDDDLHAWFIHEVKINIPRVAVCEGHVAPFTFIADLYFRRRNAIVLIAPRGGGKTFMVALLHFANGRLRKKIKAVSVGATEVQAGRTYNHLNGFIDGRKEIAPKVAAEKIIFAGKSEVEILAGSETAVNGPHPQIVHADEVEQMKPNVFSESRSMSQSALDGDGVLAPAQDIITSTRKRANGPMDMLVQEVAEAEREGLEAPYHVMTFCIFEIAQQQKNCQVARPDLPDCDKCSCHRIVKGTWGDGSAEQAATRRTLRDVCKGRFYRSRGFMPLADIKKNFMTNSRPVFEAQHTCERPSTEGMVFPEWARDRFCLIDFPFDPDNGAVYCGIDPASTHPAAVIYVQLLEYDLQVQPFNGAGDDDVEPIVIKAHSRVAFSEIYQAEMGNFELYEAIAKREALFKRQFPSFRVAGRFVDPQAKNLRLDLRKKQMPCQWFGATRDIKEQIKHAREMMDDDLTYMDFRRVPMLIDEIEHYHYPPKRPEVIDDPDLPVDDFNHAIDAWRYVLINIKQRLARSSVFAAPVSTGGHRTAAVPAAANGSERRSAQFGVSGGSLDLPTDDWRKQFMGGPGGLMGGDMPWQR